MINLIPIEHKSQRVLTTQQLADGYETSTDNISKNFIRNMDRYHTGIHYYILEGEELKAFKASGQIDGLPLNANRIFLWTERGAFYHAKSLNTDKAWEIYDSLVSTYFTSRDIQQHIDSERLSPQTQLLLQLSQSIAKSELEQQQIKQMAIEAKSGLEKAREVINGIKDTMAELPKDQWRKWVNNSLDSIAYNKGGGKEYKNIKNESYKLLDEHGFDVKTRVKNLQARLLLQGVSKSKVNDINQLDVIESDPKMRKIYDSIIKEMRIKYLV